MVIYGIINEFGYLTSKEVAEILEKYTDENGEIQERTITIESLVQELKASGWKPVDDIDESKRICEDDYHVRVTPFDAGDRISFRYEKKFDLQKLKRQIQELKDRLSETDYKIIKCYEASLLEMELPYDIQGLHRERQAIRNEINTLEDRLL